MAFTKVRSSQQAWSWTNNRTISWTTPTAGNLLVAYFCNGQSKYKANPQPDASYTYAGGVLIDTTYAYLYYKIAEGSDVSCKITYNGTGRNWAGGGEFSFGNTLLKEADFYGGDDPMDGEPGAITFTNNDGLLISCWGEEVSNLSAANPQHGGAAVETQADNNRSAGMYYRLITAAGDEGEDFQFDKAVAGLQMGFSEVVAAGGGSRRLVNGGLVNTGRTKGGLII